MNRKRYLRTVGIVLALVVVQGLALLAYRWIEHDRKATKEATFHYERVFGKPAPDLVLLAPSGSRRTLTSLRGKPVLLHFWATWCPPCKKELPGLLELGRDLERDGQLQLVAIAMDKDWDAIRTFFGGKIPPEVMRDGDGSAADRYEVSTLPDTYLIGAEGSLRLRFGGARNWRTRLAYDALREITTLQADHPTHSR